MMQHFKKVLFIGMGLLLIFLAACSDKKSDKQAEEDLDNVNKSGMPIVDDEIEMDFFAGHAATTADDWNDVLILNEYEDMTNIDIEWEQVQTDGLEEKRNLALSSKTLPDAFYGSYLPISDLQKYGKQETLIPLNDLIDEYAPNLKAIFEENPDIEKGVTFPDGNIYSLPTIYSPDFLSNLIGAKPWINKEWLDELGMDNPETTDELYEYLKAVKETELNGSGENDEIPLGSVSMDRIIHWVAGAFGIGNKGNVLNPLMDEDPDTGDLRFYPTSDNYKEMLEYLNKLYSEELIEQSIYSLETDQFLANGSDNLYGATQFFNPIELFGEEVGQDFVGGKALEGPHGDKMYTGVTSPVNELGSFAITSDNEHPAATVRWMDYFYGDDGAKLFNMGVEGETYEETEDGPELMDKITDSDEGLTTTQEMAKYLIAPGGGHPGIIKEEYFNGSEVSEDDLEVADDLESYLPEEIWPRFTYTEDESKELESLEDISKYVDEMKDKFISGKESFSEWDKYLDELDKMGLDDFMEIQEEALERYHEN